MLRSRACHGMVAKSSMLPCYLCTILLMLLSSYQISFLLGSNDQRPPHLCAPQVLHEAPGQHAATGVTGRLFTGYDVRRFSGPVHFSGHGDPHLSTASPEQHNITSAMWAVVTTVNAAMEQILSAAQNPVSVRQLQVSEV